MKDSIYTTNGNIVVRTARLDDAELIVDYFKKNKEYLKPWEPSREPEFFYFQTWKQRLIKLHELHQMALGYYLLITSVENNKMLGTVSFSQICRFPMHSCNVGYSLSEDVQGKGIMTSALILACQYMFENMNIHRISAAYMPCNLRSGRVLQRAGFKQEGRATDYLLINGQWEDHILMACQNPCWKWVE